MREASIQSEIEIEPLVEIEIKIKRREREATTEGDGKCGMSSSLWAATEFFLLFKTLNFFFVFFSIGFSLSGYQDVI